VSSHSDIRPCANRGSSLPARGERLRIAFENCLDLDGTLAERLSAYAAASREILPDYGEAVDKLVARIEENGGGRNAPALGHTMPPFVLPDESGRLVDLEALLANGPVAIMFHRGHWCPYCRMSVDALVRSEVELRSAGGQVVVITPERQEYAKRFKSDWSAPFPILTDLDNGYALSLGLAIWLTPDLQQLLSDRDLPGFHGNDAWMVPIPATFVVGTDGVVTARFIDPDFRRRMDIDSLTSALRAAP
jgi:peroxiredoxin